MQPVLSSFIRAGAMLCLLVSGAPTVLGAAADADSYDPSCDVPAELPAFICDSDPESLPADTATTSPAEPASLDTTVDLGELVVAEPMPTSAADPALDAFELLGEQVLAGQRRQLTFSAGQSFAGASIDTPVHVIHGSRSGPVVCLFAAIHGDELNGIEIVRQVLERLDAEKLRGTVVGVPIVNLLGFTRGTRYLPDRRDLNRNFPGSRNGSAASRIAYGFFEQVVRHCSYLVDFHTGSAQRTNLPQLRADLANAEVMQFTGYFGATAVMHSPGTRGMLRREAVRAHIPAVTFELGEPTTVQPEYVEYGVMAIETLFEKLSMISQFRLWSDPQPLYYKSRWIRSDRGGILITKAKLGARVEPGDLLGTVTNPISNDTIEIIAPFRGRVLGMALNQFVLPGFAAFHVGVETGGDDAPPAIERFDIVPDDPDDLAPDPDLEEIDDEHETEMSRGFESYETTTE